ncbi:hypothetical protein [Microbacterium enclense]|uniref:hypothetical protein n=1 Tax=Microbacterium enclense TaxID=993073 RepID=UPI0034455566
MKSSSRRVVGLSAAALAVAGVIATVVWTSSATPTVVAEPAATTAAASPSATTRPTATVSATPSPAPTSTASPAPTAWAPPAVSTPRVVPSTRVPVPRSEKRWPSRLAPPIDIRAAAPARPSATPAPTAPVPTVVPTAVPTAMPSPSMTPTDGADATIACDRWHFWPYGLNYASEYTERNLDRNVLVVQAMREDGVRFD